jgi:hypothetical protein
MALVRLFLIAVATICASTGPEAAAGRTIVGRITAISETSISVKSKRVEVTVNIDSRTRYTKWVRQKPWQQDVRLDVHSLKVGRLVAVHLKRESSDAAWIQIATDTR